MLIQWRDAMMIDHGIIDDDHRALLGIVTEFTSAAAVGTSEEALRVILRQLRGYALAHFRREEGLQMQVGYPYAQGHRREHGDLGKRLTGIERHFLARRPGQPGRSPGCCATGCSATS